MLTPHNVPWMNNAVFPVSIVKNKDRTMRSCLKNPNMHGNKGRLRSCTQFSFSKLGLLFVKLKLVLRCFAAPFMPDHNFLCQFIIHFCDPNSPPPSPWKAWWCLLTNYGDGLKGGHFFAKQQPSTSKLKFLATYEPPFSPSLYRLFKMSYVYLLRSYLFKPPSDP